MGEIRGCYYDTLDCRGDLVGNFFRAEGEAAVGGAKVFACIAEDRRDSGTCRREESGSEGEAGENDSSGRKISREAGSRGVGVLGFRGEYSG